VPSDGAAGSIFEAVSNLGCTIDPGEVKQKGGGGAHCTWMLLLTQPYCVVERF